jgi:hypothetical protein
MSETSEQKRVFFHKFMLFIWFVISNLIAFFLGIAYLQEQIETRPREWVNISLKKSSVSIEQSSDHIDMWINGVKKSSGESFTLEEKK